LDAIETVHSFYGEYLQNLGSEVNVLDGIIRLITDNLRGDEIVAYVTSRHFSIHGLILSKLKIKVLGGRVYFVKPSSVDMDFNIDNLLFLDGGHDSIPLRDDHLDCLVLIDLPQRDLLEKAACAHNFQAHFRLVLLPISFRIRPEF